MTKPVAKSEEKAELPVPWMAGIAGVVVIGLLLGWWWLRDGQPPPAEEQVGREIAEAFLKELRDKRPDAAWQLTSAEFRSDEGQESFRRWFGERPWLAQPLEFQEYRVGEFNGLKRAEYVYHAQAAGNNPGAANPAGTVRVVIGQEFGDWKVDSILTE